MLDEIIAPLLTTEWGRRAGWGAMIALAVIVMYTFIETMVTWRSDFVITRGQTQVMNKTLSVNELSNLIAQIPSQHLFGQSTLGEPLPVTSLQLHLVGVVKADPEKYSRVIISEAGGPGKIYKVNDVLSSGVRVYQITQDGVVLENAGRLEKLPLARTPLVFQKRANHLPEKKVEGQ